MPVYEDPSLRDRIDVFAERVDAGAHLARLLSGLELERPVVLAVPAGGVPVAAPVAEALGWPLDVAVVSKVTLPWSAEAGYGAVAFDGTEQLNHALIRSVGLIPEQVAEGIERTRRKVVRRTARLRQGRPPLDLKGRTAVLVDDGLASGFTMTVAVEAIRKAGAARIVVAVPTGHNDAVNRLAQLADDVVCANVRGGRSFAVADAYRKWHDVAEFQAEDLLARIPAAS